MNDQILYAAYHIADRIDVANHRLLHPEHLITKSTLELYYQIDLTRYVYIVSYGAVVFTGMTPDEIREYLKSLETSAVRPKSHVTADDLEVLLGETEGEITLSFETLTLGTFNHSVNKMIMMHLAQSVALDHFNGLSQSILGEIKAYTQDMQVYGKVKLGQKKAMSFIGKTLNTKNTIAENLYILDSPDVAWDNEYLDRLHDTLVRHFELVPRYREIDNTLKIVEDNLTVYMSYNHHRESSRLEWIIIILIVIEVIDTFATKLF
ncbi:RMD1 family protein [Marinoscillum sp.]|uniref:RMD1 family protein n=1 Tax=Marinoscillum sp. TaxID=2024838 RepID=UPI003BADAD36